MIRTCIITLIVSLASQLSFAETCPSIDAIKKETLTGWKAYDSDDGTLLSAERRAAYIKDIEAFALAEWAGKDRNNGSIRCYYRDHEGSALEAYLAKDNFFPNKTNYWYQVSGATQCAAGMDKCNFSHHPLMQQQQQLAKK